MAPESASTGDRRHAAAVEDATVGVEHGVVRGIEPVFVEVEGVGVLHRELAQPLQPRARAHLVAELGLNLVERHGQVAVGARVDAEEGGDHLLVRRAEREHALAAVGEAEQRRAIGAVAAGAFPQVHGRERRHEQLLRSRGVHLLADDLLHLAPRAVAQRHVAVDAGHELVDEAGAQQQVVAGRLRLGRHLAQRAPEQSRHAHAASLGAGRGGGKPARLSRLARVAEPRRHRRPPARRARLSRHRGRVTVPPPTAARGCAADEGSAAWLRRY